MIRWNSYKESKFKIKSSVIERKNFRSDKSSNNSLNMRRQINSKINNPYEQSVVVNNAHQIEDSKLKESEYYSTNSKHSKANSFCK